MPLHEETPCRALWPQGLTTTVIAQSLVASGAL
jgi:hypothetical protein